MPLANFKSELIKVQLMKWEFIVKSAVLKVKLMNVNSGVGSYNEVTTVLTEVKIASLLRPMKVMFLPLFGSLIFS